MAPLFAVLAAGGGAEAVVGMTVAIAAAGAFTAYRSSCRPVGDSSDSGRVVAGAGHPTLTVAAVAKSHVGGCGVRLQ